MLVGLTAVPSWIVLRAGADGVDPTSSAPVRPFVISGEQQSPGVDAGDWFTPGGRPTLPAPQTDPPRAAQPGRPPVGLPPSTRGVHGRPTPPAVSPPGPTPPAGSGAGDRTGVVPVPERAGTVGTTPISARGKPKDWKPKNHPYPRRHDPVWVIRPYLHCPSRPYL